MIRLTALWLAVFAVGIYTWRDWFRGLCGLVLLLGILEYPDIPRAMFGVPGLNFFNLLLVNVVFAWAAQRRHEQLKWDLPAHVTGLLVIYLLIVLIGWVRLFRDPAYLEDSSVTLVNEYLFNTIKWTVPGLLFFDGCRSRERMHLAIFSFLGALVFLGVMTIKIMPLGSVLMSGQELQRLALKLTVNRIGYHRVTLSMMLGAAFWALIAARAMLKDKRLQLGMLVTALVVLYAQSLTGGRAGWVTTGAIGLIVGVLRWRKVLLAMPAVVVIVVMFMPGVVQRILDGFNFSEYGTTTIDQYEASAGRTAIWPIVIEKIRKEPLIGYGRQAMWRTGTVTYLFTVMNEDFGHPHNAYLEWLFDNGIIGFVPVILFYLVILFHAFRLFLDRRSAICSAAGGVACVLVLALLVAGMSSQSFYPIEGTTEMWCAIGVMLRMSVERKRALALLEQPERSVFAADRDARSVPVDAAAFEALVLNGHVPERRPHTRLPFRPGAPPTIAPHFAPGAAAASAAPQFTPGRPAASGSWQRPRMPIADRSRERYRFS
jgi:O-antigen ligase